MSVTIRLAKIGKRNAPAFKVVVANTRDKRNGKFLDIVGHYNPTHSPVLLEMDKKKIKEWQEKGAMTTDAVTKLLEGKYEFQPYTRQNEVQDDTKQREVSDNEVQDGTKPTETKDKKTPAEENAEEKENTPESTEQEGDTAESPEEASEGEPEEPAKTE